jgi:hypothetical protein
MVQRTPLEMEKREILETTTTSTQAIPVKSGMERMFKGYCFASDNHNSP